MGGSSCAPFWTAGSGVFVIAGVADDTSGEAVEGVATDISVDGAGLAEAAGDAGAAAAAGDSVGVREECAEPAGSGSVAGGDLTSSTIHSSGDVSNGISVERDAVQKDLCFKKRSYVKYGSFFFPIERDLSRRSNPSRTLRTRTGNAFHRCGKSIV